jgi:hypothetical protein
MQGRRRSHGRDARRIASLVVALVALLPPSTVRAAPAGESAALSLPARVMEAIEFQVVGSSRLVSEHGALPGTAAVAEAAPQLDSWRVGIRTRLLDGPFFVGAILGRWEMTVAQTAVSAARGGVATLSASSLFVGPEVGWTQAWDVGLFAGVGVGCALSLGYRSSVALPRMAGRTDLAGVKQVLDHGLAHGVPLVASVEVGWRF